MSTHEQIINAYILEIEQRRLAAIAAGDGIAASVHQIRADTLRWVLDRHVHQER